MKIAEAEIKIVAELRKMFAVSPMGADGGMVEYQTLLKQYPDLFQFRYSGDKWQVIKGWMNRHKLG